MDHPVPWWLRAILIFIALQALQLIVVFFQPDLVHLMVPWPASALNARFIASLYVSLGFAVALSARARAFEEVRIVLLAIGLATAMLFFITLPHLGEMSPFPFFWMSFYAIDPLLVAIAFWRMGGSVLPRGVSPFAPLWLAHALIGGLIGLVLLFLPGLALVLWPWELTVPLAQIYSVFFIVLAIVSVLAAREPRWDAVNILAFGHVALALLVLGVSLLHLARFRAEFTTPLWFILFGAEAILFAGLFFLRRSAPTPVGGVAS